MLAMPLGQWRQTVVWVSGFSNYALASIGLLLFVLSMQRDWEPPAKRRAPSRLELGALLLVAFASQLFVEHVTLLITGASLVNLVVRWRLRERGVTAVALVWAIGSVAGATVMFSNTAYRTILTGGTTYQGVGAPDGGGLGSIVHQASGPVQPVRPDRERAAELHLLRPDRRPRPAQPHRQRPVDAGCSCAPVTLAAMRCGRRRGYHGQHRTDALRQHR